MRLMVTPQLREYIRSRPEPPAEIIRRAGRGRDSIYAALRGDTKTLNDGIAAALARGLGLTEHQLLLVSLGRDPKEADAAGTGTKSSPVGGNVSPAGPVRMVKVFGLAQALSARIHHGDLHPDDEWNLPEIPVTDDGHKYAAFRVEGDSMAPRLTDGAIAICDVEAEISNGCVVVCKWKDTLTIKRYRRVKDIVLLTSDNPAAGEDYEVHARDIQWCLKVVAYHGTL